MEQKEMCIRDRAWGMKKSEMENQQRKKTKSKNREMER